MAFKVVSNYSSAAISDAAMFSLSHLGLHSVYKFGSFATSAYAVLAHVIYRRIYKDYVPSSIYRSVLALNFIKSTRFLTAAALISTAFFLE